MNFAILVRGPVRPNAQAALSRAAALASEVRAQGHNATVFFAMWSVPDRAVLSLITNSPVVDHCLFTHPPADDVILDYCGGMEFLKGGRSSRNTFYQYYLSKIAIEAISVSGMADYIIHTRPDLDIRMGRHFFDWITDTEYCTLHKKLDGDTFVNDQFAVARVEIMRKAWDFGTLADLGALIQNSVIPEHVLDQMIENSDTSVQVSPFEVWELDPARNA
ncbi:hypothetical protein [Brevundimonas sp.]|uniref:hypothetical protein n=1 Tax=Brevundimonas sp. TaxID=1871086 RepID=UPI003D114551